MKNSFIHIVLFFCFINTAFAQVDDGVVALDLPIRNSLTFNRFIVHPTFSIVREQNKYISATNKRELVGVEDAPNMYMVSYSGRLNETMGASLGLFQQNYGVLTTFGGILNYAYNVRIQQDSNFTFGINLGAYQSGLNNNKVLTNFDDPALNTIPSNFLITTSPGINYGTGFLDFGLSYNNLVSYNFNTSGMVENNPKKGFQGQVMYTGYIGGYGFFSDSKFTALGITEFQKEETLISGNIMLTVPKGIWAQVGYHTLYGATGGIGINITSQLAIEYNYEKSFSGFSDLGASHEITLAYRFKNNNYYDYGGNDEVAGIFTPEYQPKKKKKTTSKAVSAPVAVAATTDTNDSEEQARIQEEEDTRKAAEEQARIQAEEEARIASEEQERIQAEEETRIAAEEEQARIQKEEDARKAAEEQARIQAEEEARIAGEEQARIQAEEEARIAAEEQARIQAEEEARIAAEEQARIQAEEEARIAAEEQARIQAEEEARVAATEIESIQEEETNVTPTDEIGISIQELSKESEISQKEQSRLIKDLESAVSVKEQDLKDLKEENDLSEQNIYVAPKPFKSITKENEAIEQLIIKLDTVILRQKKKIDQLESLLKERRISIKDPKDEVNIYYENKLTALKDIQKQTTKNRDSLLVSLEQIAVATDIERKRRIKRASYDNDQDRYTQDRKRIENLKQEVPLRTTTLNESDLDFGRKQNSNIQILKNVNHTQSGYYLVLAVHSDINKRDKFLSQVISTGNKEVDFFFDVNTSEYYIYTKKFDQLNASENALQTLGNESYYKNINIIKIEN